MRKYKLYYADNNDGYDYICFLHVENDASPEEVQEAGNYLMALKWGKPTVHCFELLS